jgi:hypothetical protein
VILNQEQARSLARYMRRWDPGDMPIDSRAIEALLASGPSADRAYFALTGEEQIFWAGAPINALTASALLFAATLTCPKTPHGKHRIATSAGRPAARLGLTAASEPERPQNICQNCGARADILRGVSAWARAQRA